MINSETNETATRLVAYKERTSQYMEKKSRLNVLIDAELHKELKLTAVKNSRTIVDLVTEAVTNLLNDMNNEEKN